MTQTTSNPSARMTAIELCDMGDMSALAQLQDIHCVLLETRAQLDRTADLVRVVPQPECCENGERVEANYSVFELLGKIRTAAQEVRELSARLSNSIGG